MSSTLPAWQPQATYSDILYDAAEGIARITINRPGRRNAFRPETVTQLIDAFHRAHHDHAIGAIILTGAGSEAFCSGGDQTVRGNEGYIDEGGTPHLNVLDLQMQIRRCPKPVVAMVAGYAIGGGHVLHLVCDLTIAAANARFGQTGPRVGSFDAGLGAGLMARTIGMKRAKEIWLLCRQYDAATALDWGLVNAVVPVDQLEEETVELVPRHAQAVADGAAPDQGRLQRRHRRAGRHPGTGRQRHRPVLHERGRPGRPQRLARTPPPRFRQVPQAPVKVDSADWLPYCLPLKCPWQTSRGALGERHGRLLRLRSADGLIGWGDCAPLPEFGIDEAAAEAFAEECAALDLAAQRARLPLNAWLSGSDPVRSVAVNASFGPVFSVDLDSLDHAAAAGFTVAKLKVGVAPVDDEIDALQRVASVLAPGLRLRLDANRAWTFATARRFVAACAGLPIDGLEEPLAEPDPALLASLQAAAAFPLAVDESTHLLDAHFFRHPPVRRLVIKPARLGGLLASTELALRARASGLEVIITAALESACGIATLAHLAAAVAPESCHGLATADWFAGDTGQPPAIIGGRMQLPRAGGTGFLAS